MRFDPSSAWWGPPKKFDRNMGDRRVSWLELFYDLVYVIAIARITHHLTNHISIGVFFEYVALFILIFWGWLNGSLYHDLHGNKGLRTQLTTLWQMMIIAALTITLEQTPERPNINTTIVFMIMQFYITYLWWSVGFYDKAHRRYNLPYTIFYMFSLGLMGISLVVSESWLKFIVPVVLICNYIPPFIAYQLMRRSSIDLDLSPSMFERLGLFTIIVFGELVLGVINGIGDTHHSDLSTWLNFALAISIVFALWWIFFALISNREVKKGFFKATVMELLFIPTLISISLMAACFSYFFDSHSLESLQMLFGFSVTVFLSGINMMMGLIKYHETMQPIKQSIRVSLLITAIIFFLIAISGVHIEGFYYLIAVLVILLIEITYLNSLYYRLNPKGEREE